MRRSLIAPALATFAVALGIPAAGSAAPRPVLAPATAPAPSISAMACYGPKSCIGLGDYTPAQADEYYLKTWNGVTWGSAFGKFPGSKNDVLYALWCSAATHCVAVGETSPAAAASPAPLVATWNGAAWSVRTAPAPVGPQGAWFNGVWCASAHLCMAVGDYTRPGLGFNGGPLTEGFADAWNGAKWSVSRVMKPKVSLHVQSDLYGVSCPSVSRCVAVGDSFRTFAATILRAKTALAVTQVWNGKAWQQVNAPAPAGGHGQLTGVSCWSAKGCMASGFSYQGKFAQIAPLADRWNGAKWSAFRPPTTGYAPVLEGVSCATARSCLAVGTNNGGGSYTRSIRAIADAWNGTKWRAEPVPVPSKASGNSHGDTFFAVTCASPANCVAFGAYGPRHGTSFYPEFPFAESWNGTRMRIIADS